MTIKEQLMEDFKAAMAGVILRYDGTANTLHHSMTEEVKSYGRNLLNPSLVELINCVIESDGRVRITGSNPSVDIPLKKGTYTVSFESSGNCYLRKGKISDGYMKIMKTGSYTFTYDSDEYLRVSSFLPAGSYIDNLMIVKGSVATDSVPYHEPYTLTIPSDWYNVEDIGIEGTVIDLVEKKVTWNYGKVDLGSLSWSQKDHATYGIYYVSSI